MVETYSKSVFDYLLCVLLIVLMRLLYGPPSFLLKLFNFITFCIFAFDKYQGVRKGIRVAENVLFLCSLCGGWIGGLLAMLVLKHKTSKSSFMLTMGVIVLVNLVIVAYLRGLFKI